MPCIGNSSEFCGGPNRLNLYNYTGTDLPGGGGAGTPTPTQAPTQAPAPAPTGTGTVSPVTSGLPTPWTYAACYV